MLLKILSKTVSQRFSSYETIINIKNGEINGDQTIPIKRKTAGILHIDQNSAVVSFAQKTGYKLMLAGIHDLPRAAFLCAVLPLYSQRAIFGPVSADSLSLVRSGEGLADFHVRLNTAKLTATKAANGIVVYPKFECFYRIDIAQQKDEFLEFIKHSYEPDKDSLSTITSEFLQKYLCILVMNHWGKVCSGKTSRQLMNEIPFKLFPDGFAKNGLAGQVFVSEIFLEN